MKLYQLFVLPVICMTSVFMMPLSAQQDGTQNSGEWQSLDRPTYHIDYPADWTVDESKASGTTFILYAPAESESDGFRENVNFIEQDLKAHRMDLDAYTDFSLNQIKSMGYTLQSSERKDRDGVPYSEVSYSNVVGDYHLVYHQYFWVVGNAAYILTFTSEADKLADYKDAAEHIMNSFSLRL